MRSSVDVFADRLAELNLVSRCEVYVLPRRLLSGESDDVRQLVNLELEQEHFLIEILALGILARFGCHKDEVQSVVRSWSEEFIHDLEMHIDVVADHIRFELGLIVRGEMSDTATIIADRDEVESLLALRRLRGSYDEHFVQEVDNLACRVLAEQEIPDCDFPTVTAQAKLNPTWWCPREV